MMMALSTRVFTVLRNRARRRRQFSRGAYLLPSLFTMANMFCGYCCIIYSLRGDYATAAPFIGLAIVLAVAIMLVVLAVVAAVWISWW